jgi:hypothetical protein
MQIHRSNVRRIKLNKLIQIGPKLKPTTAKQLLHDPVC